MGKNNGIFAVLAVAAGTAWAEDLSLPTQKHTVTCHSLAACPIRKPEGVGGWELLTKGAVLEEKGEGLWFADFSKLKGVAGGKATLRVLAADGKLIQVDAKVSKR